MKIVFIALIHILFGLLLGGAVSAAPQPSYMTLHDPIGAIESDYRAGALTFSQKALLQIQAIKRPNLLPTKYQIFDSQSGLSYGRTATLAIRDIYQNWNLLDAPTQYQINQLLTRWSTAFTYVSPSGFFKLHYDTSGGNAVPASDGNGNSVPDYVERCAAYMDTSYAKHMALGYLPPPSDGTLGGDSKFDVYFEQTNLYGYAVAEGAGPQPWNDAYSYLVLNRNFLGFPPNTDPEGNQAGAAKSTAAHEFHHCIQYAYDAGEASWYMELDATQMEDIVFDQVNDNYNYLSLMMDHPEVSLMDQGLHMYASFLWGMYLVERFDTSISKAVWEGARYKSVYATLSDTLLGRYGRTQDSAFADFTLWNYFSGSRDDGQHYSEGAAYAPDVAIGRVHTTYPVTTQTGPVKPQGYGTCYIRFVSDGAPGKLRLIFDGEDAASWAAFLIKTSGTGTSTTEKLYLPNSPWVDTIEVPNFSTYQSVTLVVVNINEFDIARDFLYSAAIVLPYAVDASFQGDSLIYSGGQRDILLRVKNVGPVPDAYKVSFSDAAGWIVPGFKNIFLNSGDSGTITVSAKAPVGTPIGSFSNATFVATSQNDPVVSVTRQRREVAILQRGDVNFSGKIDLTDLSTLIQYALTGAPQPQPTLEAGNLNCVGIVDLADLSLLIAYLIGTGQKPPCNPY